METEMFVVLFGIGLAALLGWGFRTLTGERWQILGALPVRKGPGPEWVGLNLTYYGFFNACAYTLAAGLFLMMLGAVGAPLNAAGALLAALMAVCMPASRLIAFVVEKKRHTFSVAGASFAGLLIAPWMAAAMPFGFDGWAAAGLRPMTVLAALTIAYTFGEGVGRLACISFGCCYGKPLTEVHPRLRRLFRHRHFVFRGGTRKIAYAGGCEGVPVVPVQAITAVVYCTVGLCCLYGYLKAHFTAAFLVGVLSTQGWRFVSEFLRADDRGRGRLSRYQLMAAGAVLYGLLVAWRWHAAAAPVFPDVAAGLRSLWRPPVMILLQVLWVTAFLYTGRSRVTGSRIRFHVNRERV